MLRRSRNLILLLVIVLSLSSRAFAAATMTVSIGGGETQLSSGAWDTGTITISFADSTGRNYSEGVVYGQYSTPTSIASAFGAMFSNSYVSVGLYAHATGNVITFWLTGAATLEPPTITNPSASFVDTPSTITSLPIAQSVSGPGIITTVVGGGTGCSGETDTLGDGCSAAQATLRGPAGMSFDNSGNIYIADSGDNRIRMVSATTGIISTIAGNGSCGQGNIIDIIDSPVATNAPLCAPQVITNDSEGNIYFAYGASDPRGGGLVVKLTASSGMLSVVAGNDSCSASPDGVPAINASLCTIGGIAIDAVGDIYLSDSGHNAVREVVAATGNIQTLANVASPIGLTLDQSGNLYIAATDILKLNLATNDLSTVVGDEGYCYSVVADGVQATNSTACSYAVAVDHSGNIYFPNLASTDSPNNETRKVWASTGIIDTVAGTGVGCSEQTDEWGDGCPSIEGVLAGANGVAVDSSGNVYISDTGDNRVRVISASTQTQTPAFAVECSPSTITYGTTSDCSVSVGGGATGTVSLYLPNGGLYDDPYAAGAPLWTTISLSTGVGTVTWPAGLPVGGYTIFGNYNGDTVNTPETVPTTLTIAKATPSISWATPAPITYGSALTAAQLDATSTVPGTFAYSPTIGTNLSIGTHTLSVIFTPTDNSDYITVATSVSLTVNTITPTITWQTPSSIEYGTPLSIAQLNATANTPGTFVYAQQVGAVLPIGTQTLSVTFTPSSPDYSSVQSSVQLTVTSDTPVITSVLPYPWTIGSTVTVGSTVTIAGQNFGPSQGSSILTFHGVTAAVSSWTDSLITATVPAGATTGNVVVTVAGTPSNGFLVMIPLVCAP